MDDDLRAIIWRAVARLAGLMAALGIIYIIVTMV